MKADPPRYEYATDVVGRTPQLKYHKTLGHAKNAFQAKYNYLARKHDRIMYRVEGDQLVQIYCLPGGAIRPDIMPWENEYVEALKRQKRAELILLERRLESYREEVAQAVLDVAKLRQEIQALEESNG